MEHDTAGDPVTGVKWTRRTTEKVADELASAGIEVCPNTVAKLLKGLGYRLRSNAKKLNRTKDPGRDAQFAYIASMRETFAKAGLPVVSVDAKHRELVGDFRNPGATWGKEPEMVLDHDFPSDAKGVALPYGVYDLAANHACVSVGTSHDTPVFAADNLARWWDCHGRARYPGAAEMLVLADSGGSNGARCKAWKYGLQHRLCDPYGLTVTVCHYPSGASKYNPVEHRAFSEISKNWAGKPLRDYETVVNYISTTRTKTGLGVDAHLVWADYRTGVKVSAKEMKDLSVRQHDTQPSPQLHQRWRRSTSSTTKVHWRCYYMCFSRQRYGKAACVGERLRADVLEDAVFEALLNVYKDPELIERAVAAKTRERTTSMRMQRDEILATETELKKTEAAIERYMMAFEAGSITDDLFGPRVRDLSDKARALRARHEELTQIEEIAAMDPPTQADLDSFRTDLEDELLHGSNARRKAVAQAFVHRLVIDGRDTIHPTFYVRGSLPPDMTGADSETATDGRSRAVTPTVGSVGIEPTTKGL